MNDDDIVHFVITHSEDMKHVTLEVVSPSTMTPKEYVDCLLDFAYCAEKDPKQLFENAQVLNKDRH